MGGELAPQALHFQGQGSEHKFNPKWLHEKSPTFLLGNQLRDSIFWNIASACTVWTAYEALMMWSYANGFVPYVDWETQPVTFVLMLLAVALWREVHFYWSHRLVHWKPLYRSAHYLHHKNVNVGPWSGLAMHPIEHMIYFSSVLLYWIVPSHPISCAVQPAARGAIARPGHSGFDQFVLSKKGQGSHRGLLPLPSPPLLRVQLW